MRKTECFGFPFGCVAVVAAASAAGLLGSARHHVFSLLALGLVVLLTGVVTSVTATAGTAVIAWGVHSGFTVGTLGALQFTAETGVAAVVFAAATVLGSLAGAVRRSGEAAASESPHPLEGATRTRLSGPAPAHTPPMGGHEGDHRLQEGSSWSARTQVA
ncbi:hypothetical protein DMH01_31890 [Amycolatopsis sp. WAC 04182]|uniref:hypothetical protein n=1 Tax=Amycolatopsis sp. WAC 04182 TaxID=2203198 RepID=UPI000F798AA7|nr:hypothetical protein [Amycolatopsis sp. WAC 04182]RSN56383.1 hypothetical protein DMH01_31890 [Amycolatopsis sp. WAC 04182]